jgi:hypothetical protein
LHRVLADWGEGVAVAPGGGGGGNFAASGDATWNARFFGISAWTTPGGDFSVTVSGSQFAAGTPGAVVIASAGLAADVQGWINNPASNFGWIIVAQNEASSAVRFSSREGSVPPSLQVNYTESGTNTPHSADTDGNFRISLLELTRVIELYNTRFGTVRTGCYSVAITPTEDGFMSDPTRPGTVVVTLTKYHSGDSNHDGKLSLLELTRVIELYNYRSGTTRTGQYHVQAGTEDGFAPGP